MDGDLRLTPLTPSPLPKRLYAQPSPTSQARSEDGREETDPPGRGHRPGHAGVLSAGRGRRVRLRRRTFPDRQPAHQGRRRTAPVLVHDRGRGLFPADLDLALARMAVVGQGPDGLSRRQHAPACGERGARLAGAQAAERARRVAGGVDLRRSSGERGVRRVDHRAEERAGAAVLPAQPAALSAVREFGRGRARMPPRWRSSSWRC